MAQRILEATYIKPFVSPLHWQEVAAAFFYAFNRQSSFFCRDDQLALLLAKSALETGRWKKIRNYEFGNVKAGKNYVGSYTCFVTSEIYNGIKYRYHPDGRIFNLSTGQVTKPVTYSVPPGHPETRFRAHKNVADGAHAYIYALKTYFPKSWAVLQSANPTPHSFVNHLKQERYFTAPEAEYAKAVASLYQEYLRKLKGLNFEQDEELPNCDLKQAIATIQFEWRQLLESEYEPEESEKKV